MYGKLWSSAIVTLSFPSGAPKKHIFTVTGAIRVAHQIFNEGWEGVGVLVKVRRMWFDLDGCVSTSSAKGGTAITTVTAQIGVAHRLSQRWLSRAEVWWRGWISRDDSIVLWNDRLWYPFWRFKEVAIVLAFCRFFQNYDQKFCTKNIRRWTSQEKVVKFLKIINKNTKANVAFDFWKYKEKIMCSFSK